MELDQQRTDYTVANEALLGHSIGCPEERTWAYEMPTNSTDVCPSLHVDDFLSKTTDRGRIGAMTDLFLALVSFPGDMCARSPDHSSWSIYIDGSHIMYSNTKVQMRLLRTTCACSRTSGDGVRTHVRRMRVRERQNAVRILVAGTSRAGFKVKCTNIYLCTRSK